MNCYDKCPACGSKWNEAAITDIGREKCIKCSNCSMIHVINSNRVIRYFGANDELAISWEINLHLETSVCIYEKKDKTSNSLSNWKNFPITTHLPYTIGLDKLKQLLLLL